MRASDDAEIRLEYVANVQEITLKLQVADLDQRRLQARFNARDLSCKARDEKRFALTRASMIERPYANNVQSLGSINAQCKIRRRFCEAVFIGWREQGTFTKRETRFGRGAVD